MKEVKKQESNRAGLLARMDLLYISGIVYLLLGIVVQFKVNDLRMFSVAGLVFSALFLIVNVLKKSKWQYFYAVFAVMNILGIIIDRFTMLAILGLSECAAGVFLVVMGILAMYRNKASKGWKIPAIIMSAVLAVVAVLLCSMTIYPSGISTWMRDNMMHARNVSEAEISESTVADGSRLLSDVQYDAQVPNGYMDIYYSASPLGDKPVTAIFLHGGGYIWGDKANGDPNAGGTTFEDSTCAALLAHGYNVVQMNYCLMPEYPYPEAILQLNRGLKYLYEHADELGLNMDAVVIGGASAGGNLAGVLVNLQTNPGYAAQLGTEAAVPEGTVKAAFFEGGLFDNSQYGVTGSGGFDWLFTNLGRIYLDTNEIKTDRKVDPSNVKGNVTSAFPPTFISDGNTGTFNEQAFAFDAELQALGVPTVFNYFPKETATLNHGFEEGGSEYAKETFANMMAFFDTYVD